MSTRINKKYQDQVIHFLIYSFIIEVFGSNNAGVKKPTVL